MKYAASLILFVSAIAMAIMHVPYWGWVLVVGFILYPLSGSVK